MHLMSLHVFSLITQCDAPVSAKALTVTALGPSLLLISWSWRLTLTLTLGTDFSSSALEVWKINPSNCDIEFVDPFCGGGVAVGVGAVFCLHCDSWWFTFPQFLQW